MKLNFKVIFFKRRFIEFNIFPIKLDLETSRKQDNFFERKQVRDHKFHLRVCSIKAIRLLYYKGPVENIENKS